jgi:hypothetical protein
MTRPAPHRGTKARTLAQQQTDFTAEGAPPPGKVATSVPVTGGKTARPVSRPPAIVPATRRRPASGKGH